VAVEAVEAVDGGHPKEALAVFQYIFDKIITQALIGGVTNEGALAGLPPEGTAGKQLQEEGYVFAQMAEILAKILKFCELERNFFQISHLSFSAGFSAKFLFIRRKYIKLGKRITIISCKPQIRTNSG
jgi:hypothetical protein